MRLVVLADVEMYVRWLATEPPPPLEPGQILVWASGGEMIPPPGCVLVDIPDELAQVPERVPDSDMPDLSLYRVDDPRNPTRLIRRGTA